MTRLNIITALLLGIFHAAFVVWHRVEMYLTAAQVEDLWGAVFSWVVVVYMFYVMMGV